MKTSNIHNNKIIILIGIILLIYFILFPFVNNLVAEHNNEKRERLNKLISCLEVSYKKYLQEYHDLCGTDGTECSFEGIASASISGKYNAEKSICLNSYYNKP